MTSLGNAGSSKQSLLWLLTLLSSAGLLYAAYAVDWVKAYPADWEIPLISWTNSVFAWLQEFNAPFRYVASIIKVMMEYLQYALQGMPWLVLGAFVTAIAFRANGTKLAVFAACCVGYTLLVGLWVQTINTLALVLISIPFVMLLGFGVGVLAAKSRVAARVMLPLLDLMQTVPAFAYLIPAMVLLGFGPQVGLLVSIIFATPPMVRNVMLGLRAVPQEIKEAADMSGASPWQRFWVAEIPTAMGQIIIGFNQSVLAAFSMVIVASVIGGFNDIGWEVSGNFRNQALGKAIEAGIVVTLFAVLIDRIGAGFARRSMNIPAENDRSFIVPLALLLLTAFGVALALPEAWSFPKEWTLSLAAFIDTFMLKLLEVSAEWLRWVKFVATVFLIKPIQVGLDDAVNERFWGVALSPSFIAAYAVSIVIASLYAARIAGSRGFVFVVLVGTLVYFGANDIPWPLWAIVVGTITLVTGGAYRAVMALLGVAFILTTGMWEPAVSSISLLIVAVAICILLGGAIGLVSAEWDALSPIVRQVNDFLQSIPVYVLLIPPLWLFRTSEFASMLAVVMYAIVPCIRYTEFGLRSVSPNTIEAARSLGMTRWQLLKDVKIPLATPQIALGINQTVLMALSMLVIAALITSNGLGQEIYNALGQRDPGSGLAAGLAIAIIAMIIDQIFQSVSRRKAQAIGMSLV